MERGYTIDFSLMPNGIEDKAAKKVYDPSTFTVDEYHRFEGVSNPGDMSIVFAVTTNDGKKGTLIDAYGTYEDPLESEMLHKLKLDESR
ncbi:MAG: phosphoribosylpyrophosphate synthetase [Owenweeksia sp.]|nr:phosphoribosylpyrophosphate synthetase [Owenweeksia sp.]